MFNKLLYFYSFFTECRLGKTVHEIGDTWNPDLGEPFGTMYCIECACEPVRKKIIYAFAKIKKNLPQIAFFRFLITTLKNNYSSSSSFLSTITNQIIIKHLCHMTCHAALHCILLSPHCCSAMHTWWSWREENSTLFIVLVPREKYKSPHISHHIIIKMK